MRNTKLIKDAKRDIHIKAIVVVGALTVILMVAALYMYMNSSRKKIDSDNRTYLQDNTTRIAVSIDDALTSGYQNIKILSTMLSNSLTSKEVDIASIQQLVENSVFDFMEFADSEGMDHNITGGVSDAKDRKYYLDAMAGNTGMELIYHSRATHETLLMFYSPVYYKEEIVGSLVGVYQATNRITKLLTTQYYGEPASSFLCTEEGRIVASTLPLNTEIENRIEDIAGEDTQAREKIKEVLNTGSTMSVKMGENEAGVCMTQLPQNKWFVLQIFPEAASREMISSSYSLVFRLVGFLFVNYLILMISLTLFERKQQRIVEEANSSKTTFLFNMSHDIRTPMNAILGFTNIAMNHVDEPERVSDSLKKIKLSGGHLLNLINDILEMSRIEAGKMEIVPAPINAYEVTEGVVTMSRSLAETKDITFNVKADSLKNPYIYSDELHTNQVIINLVSNAIKYTDPGGTVDYSIEQISDPVDGIARYRISVKDNGIGMSEEFQEHLFESFSREQSATVSKQEGAGLGLAIVKKIIDMMGGTIAVQSKLGEGSTFVVELPFEVMDEKAIEEYEASRKKDIAVTDEISFDGQKVLLVEDNEMNREIATEILEEVGLVIETAEDGAIAVRKVMEKGTSYYDFILMDIQMPVMDGYEATAEIRKMPDADRIPIIALSANAFKEDMDRSIAAGMNAHVAKPIDVKALFETIKRLIK